MFIKLQFIISFLATLFIMDLFIYFSETQSLPTKNYNENDVQERRSNVKLTFFNEGFFFGSTNGDGFLGDRINREETENNIVLIGDSYIEGFQLFQRHHFMTHLKNILKNTLGANYSVINRGMGEQNLSDSYISLRTSFADSSTFIVFINPDQLHLKNYVSKKKPFLYLENERLNTETGYKNERKYEIYKQISSTFLYSTIFQSIKLMINKIIIGKYNEIIFGKLTHSFHREPKNAVIQNDFNQDISEINKRILLDLSRQRNIFLVLMKNITKSQKNFFDLNSIRTINLGIPLSDLKNSGLDPYYWNVTKMEGHWNHYGHKAIGGFIADEIIEEITR